jgi:ribosomal RNA-processing protein 12
MLLQLAVDTRPKVRKIAQSSVIRVLDRDSAESKPLLVPLEAFLMSVLAQANAKDAVKTLHALNLLKEVISFFPSSALKRICEKLLQLPSYKQNLLTTVALQCLQSLFSSPTADVKMSPVSAWISALLEIQPSLTDWELLAAFVRTITLGVIRLHEVDASRSHSLLPNVFTYIVGTLRGQSKDLAELSIATAKEALRECVDSELIAEAYTAATSGVQRDATILAKVLAAVENGLSYAYNAHWDAVLNLIAAFYEHLGASSSPLMDEILKNIGLFHDTDEFQFRRELNSALGAAVSAIGPQRFLNVLPLKLDTPNEMRAWLLPILSNNIHGTELAFFGNYFVPLSARCAAFASVTQSKVQARTYQTIYVQIWDLLPGFCKLPVDCAQSFREVGKILNDKLESGEEPLEVQQAIIAGLRTLITRFQKLVEEGADERSSVSVQQAQDSLRVISSYAKYFIPHLFTAFNGPLRAQAQG